MRNEFEVDPEAVTAATKSVNGWTEKEIHQLAVLYGIFDTGEPEELLPLLDTTNQVIGALCSALLESATSDPASYNSMSREVLMEVAINIGLYIGAEYMRSERPHG